jgi:hypothetical protein
VRPDLLLRLLLQLTESAHAQQCSIPDFFSDYQALVIKSPVMLSPALLSTLMGAAEPRRENAWANCVDAVG